MYTGTQEQRWFWATLVLSSVSIAAVVFAVWEVTENRFFRHVDYLTLHYLYITRGIASSLLLAVWAAWYVIRQRRRAEEELHRSREHYRSLLDASPGAVVLYDASLNVIEWNATAQRLYGFTKEEVLGKTLPTVPPEKEAELRAFLGQAASGVAIPNVETLRRNRQGEIFDVELSLLPFQEAGGRGLYLEVTEDIRERVRLREKLLEIEKLTTMGMMAAGTAHHLNTPMAALLLRVQMMRERAREPGALAADLERLETGIGFCQQFVGRLLQFSRRPPVCKQAEEIGHLVRGVLDFLTPAVVAKRGRILLEPNSATRELVLGDRNLLEATFSVLITNALDAIPPQGSVTVRCLKPDPEYVEIQISDNGCGIDPADLPRVFEPFFTTKGPGKGTGLGLSIAKSIVLEHGGSIRLESVPNQGTTVSVQLPRYQPSADNSGATA